jgi:hypothetical protein
MKGAALVLLGSWLAVWFFWIGTAMGGLANVWLHNLSGGAWGEAIRSPLRRAGKQLPWTSLLVVPVLAGMTLLYPWAGNAADGIARWQGELSAAAFKNAWLSPPFFAARSVVYLLVWNGLALATARPSLERSKPLSAAALIIYGFSMSAAAVDWIMSLMPLWYSSVFGWLVCIGQMLAGMAFGIVRAVRASGSRPGVYRDLGNLLLMYVLMWAYLAFSQFLIIWAENLPHEIVWYVARRSEPWLAVSWLLAVFFFFAPLLVLLSRHVKETPGLLDLLARALLVLQLLNTCWLVLPSLAVDPRQWLWAVPLATVLAWIVATLLWRHGESKHVAAKEEAHA